MFSKYVVVLLTTAVAVLVGIAGLAESADIEAGQALYEQRCAPCHGPDGKANTPTAKALQPPPRDHTDGAVGRTSDRSHQRRRSRCWQIPNHAAAV